MKYIYLIESYSDFENIYKIGYSKNPKQRIKELKTAHPHELTILYEFPTKHGRKVESSLHRLFKHKCYDGEWFRLNEEDISKFLIMCENIENSLDMNFD